MTYQSAFLVTEDGVVFFVAPPRSGRDGAFPHDRRRRDVFLPEQRFVMVVDTITPGEAPS